MWLSASVSLPYAKLLEGRDRVVVPCVSPALSLLCSCNAFPIEDVQQLIVAQGRGVHWGWIVKDSKAERGGELYPV